MTSRFELDSRETYSTGFLRWFKRRALRRRAWYRELNRLERGIVDACLRVVERVRSSLLFRALRRIVSKLSWVLETWFTRRVRAEGSAVAEQLVETAESIGFSRASRWRGDPEYVWFLGVRSLSDPF